MNVRAICVGLCLFVVVLSVSTNAISNGVQSVSVSKSFFNPSLGDSVAISFVAAKAGNLSIQIIDRDGFLVRTLITETTTAKKVIVEWDGRNGGGHIVPDEAYSVRVILDDDIYFPADREQPHFVLTSATYNKLTGLLAYDLPKSCRIHAQAGVATIDPKTKEPNGPVMKTIVNREPRSSGRVLEHWNGMDESGSIYVPDLKNFVVAVAATELPDTAIIAVGNKTESFLDSVANRTGKSLFTHISSEHSHHQGLDSLNDSSPTMILQPSNASWSSSNQAWITGNDVLNIDGSVTGPSSPSFAQQPAKLLMFVDGNKVGEVSAPSTPFALALDTKNLETGDHIVSIDWASNYGPTSCNSFRLKLQRMGDAKEGK
ncbi:MAG: hypothetical protein C5B54_06225 [Acidobacteria bacterium]|nr:MAG: hypothetical protein C5B54_06225 [Acidobacteriota bacterium]